MCLMLNGLLDDSHRWPVRRRAVYTMEHQVDYDLCLSDYPMSNVWMTIITVTLSEQF